MRYHFWEDVHTSSDPWNPEAPGGLGLEPSRVWYAGSLPLLLFCFPQSSISFPWFSLAAGTSSVRRQHWPPEATSRNCGQSIFFLSP